MTQAPQADAAPVCIATTTADADSIAPYNRNAKPARSDTFGAMVAVARISETIRLYQRGRMRHADV
jgi:hypothetical protein